MFSVATGEDILFKLHMILAKVTSSSMNAILADVDSIVIHAIAGYKL